MNPDITDRPGFLIVGIRSLWNLDPGAVKSLWMDKALPRRGEIQVAPGAENFVVGVFAPIPETLERKFEYVAGMAVLSLEGIPDGMVGWEIPQGTYASVPTRGLENVYPAYRELLESWLPASGYELGPGPVFVTSPYIDNPADSASSWKVNVQIRKPGSSLGIESWGV